MVNKRILEYYLESEYFHLAINDLCDDFSGICEKAEEEFLFRTDIEIELSEMLKEKNQYYSILKNHHIYTYFNRDYDDLQLSAIIWGILLGFDRNETALIANKHYASFSLVILEMLLCGTTISDIKKALSNRKRSHIDFYYKGTYYVSDIPINTTENQKINWIMAEYSIKENCLIDVLGNRYILKY